MLAYALALSLGELLGEFAGELDGVRARWQLGDGSDGHGGGEAGWSEVARRWTVENTAITDHWK